MATKPERIYWDSCCYISCIQETPGRAATLKGIIARVEAGGAILVASSLVIAEVVKLDNTKDQAQLASQAKKIRDFFRNPYLKVRAVDRGIAESAADISRQHGIKPPDAIHLATALFYKCDCFQTYDGEDGDKRKLLAFDGKIGLPPLPIKLPALPPAPMSLFAGDDDA